MEYRIDEHFIYLTGTPFSMKDEIQSKLSGVYTKKGYRFPRNVYVMRELVKFFPELKEKKGFVELGQDLAEEEKEWKWQKETAMYFDIENKLRTYQCHDVGYLSTRGSSLVLNEPRTGKTPTMIKTLAALNTKRNLIVCPSSLVYNWAKEFKTWYPGMKVLIASGTPKKRIDIYTEAVNTKQNYVLIISKDTLKIDIEKNLSISFETMIVDEAHFLRNYKSIQSKAVFSVKANTKYALTGTPAVKHGVDVYGLLHFINPEAFPSYWQFADRYWNIDDGMWGKSIQEPKKYREKELKALLDVNSVQRKRKEVMKWLPEAQHQTLPVVMEKKQLKLYDQMMETFVAHDTENIVTAESNNEVDAMNVLVQLTRLRQLCLDPRLLGFDVPGTKTKALLEFAEDNQDPFIVMTTFSSYFKIIKPELEKLGKRVGIIDGSISKQKKMATAERFQNGGYDVLLCNIIAAGTGFTLDRADTIVFLDKDFNPANNEQAQDRIVPTTKERYHNINIISLVAEGSIDERVNDILDRKEDLTSIINKRELINN